MSVRHANITSQKIPIVAVCLGCYNEVSQTGCLINSRNVLFTVLEAEKFEIWVSGWSDVGSLPDHRLLVS